MGAGAARFVAAEAGTAFEQLRRFQLDAPADWLFGFFGYDLKNEVERLSSRHFDGIGLPDLVFFQPETVVGIRGDRMEIHTLKDAPEAVWTAIRDQNVAGDTLSAGQSVLTSALQSRFSKDDYLATVEALRQHIVEGDVYEVNLCQEFFVENTGLDPVAVFKRLNAIAQAPFTAFLRWGHRYLLSASPERFLKKTGQKLISQPIKGTRKRGQTPEEDDRIRRELAGSEKDRAENVMIVDLVRNDLARHCLPGSVQVEELFGIHSFATVHQMISTVSGTLPNPPLSENAGGVNAPMTHEFRVIHDAFPMGSMTGAPKVMAMQLIEQYERSRRGLYSGAVGYFDPSADFDFNVVIRSILYNEDTGYVSFQVGGAIVYDSDPEQEYEECLLKAAAMRRALMGEGSAL